MTDSSPVERYFDRRSAAYDRRYDRERLQLLVRPGLLRGRDHVVSLARSLGRPRVLEAGCGPGRLGEALLAAGTPEYVGVDLSRAMVELARQRLEPFGSRATIVHADFANAEVDGPFALVVALGMFDYVDEPEMCLRHMASECSGVLVATFPRWDPWRDPVRTIVYERLHGCPLRHYDAVRLSRVLADAGIGDAEVVTSRSGFRVTARRSSG